MMLPQEGYVLSENFVIVRRFLQTLQAHKLNMIKREKLARHPRTKWRIWACDVRPTSRIEQWALRTLVWCSYGQKWQVSAFQMTVVKRREIFRKFICRQTDFPRWDYDRPFRLWIAFGDTGDRLWSSTALPMEQRVNHDMASLTWYSMSKLDPCSTYWWKHSRFPGFTLTVRSLSIELMGFANAMKNNSSVNTHIVVEFQSLPP